jgi:hypothetical protein
MLMLMTSVVAVALLAQAPDSVLISGVVIDSAGKPLAGVQVLLAGRRPDGAVPTLARTTTDEHGAFHLEIAASQAREYVLPPVIWAYRPGYSVAVQSVVVTGKGAPPSVRVTLGEPLRRTVTMRGSDDRPLAGVQVAPVCSRLDSDDFLKAPDDWLEQLSIKSGADGIAILSCLSARIEPLTLRVKGPGLAPHDIPVTDHPAQDRINLVLARPARLTGSVYSGSGQPASNVPIEVWEEDVYLRSRRLGREQKTRLPALLIRFEAGPVRTGADGSFLTPPELLTGSTYRIMIRTEGDPLVTSDRLTATTELTTVPVIRLQQHRKVIGVVNDRQGKPVAGARVSFPSGDPSTTTDAQGRFLLEGTLPEKTFLIVRAEGFRFQGWPAIPAREPAERKLVLARTSEPPGSTMAPQPALISSEESRDLARQLFEPVLEAALADGSDTPKARWLRVATKIDPGRVLELLEKHPFRDPGTDAAIRSMVALERLTADPTEAESIVNAIADRSRRAWAYVQLAAAVPATERDRKRRYLELATVQARAPAAMGGAVDRRSDLNILADIAEGWLNLGDVEKARPLIRGGLELVAALPVIERYQQDFLSTAARVEPERVLSIVREFSDARRWVCYAEIAQSLAIEHPAEAERVFHLIDDSPPRPFAETKARIALRICKRLAATDPEAARRIIAWLKLPQEQACAWALLALGLADRDNPAARAALGESIRVIDRLLDSPAAVTNQVSRIMVANNPAASILPIVEKVAPEQLEEVFWRAIALVPKDERARERGVVSHGVAGAAIFLARYDRQAADVFVQQAMSSDSRNRGAYSPIGIRAIASVDPRGAVALMKSVPAGLNLEIPANRVMEQAREGLVTYLVEPAEAHGNFVWSQSMIPLDER